VPEELTELLDAETRQLLQRYGFDQIPFGELRRRLLDEPFDRDQYRLRGRVEQPSAALITDLPAATGEDAERITGLGRRAIESGRVAAVVLNGGMATRFGGLAKGVLEPLPGRSFLDLKLNQIAVAGGGRIGALVMNSFATEQPTAEHLERLAVDLDVRQLSQLISLRLTPEGGLFLGADGRPSLHAPGHGDLPHVLGSSGELERMIEGGVRVIAISNVDNLGAGIDPLVIGMHLEQGRPLTVELVEPDAGDVGGFPALVDGAPMIVEMFRLPRGFDPAAIPVFNTNTFVCDARSLVDPPQLDWFAVPKQVDGRTAIQFERLVGQLSEHLEVGWLRVPRHGPASRFVPIKVPADIERRGEELQAVLGAQGVL
jgi:UTP--glucose-1-phosphate uridylyltransferase